MRDIVNLRIRQCFGADYGTPGAPDAPGCQPPARPIKA
jgi:hypothetical protein